MIDADLEGGPDEPPASGTEPLRDPSVDAVEASKGAASKMARRPHRERPRSCRAMRQAMAAEWPASGEYQRNSKREIPAVALERV